MIMENRYQRHIQLSEIGQTGQDKIKKATERMTKSLAPQPVPVKRTEPINNPSKIDISIPKFGATNERTDSN